MSRPIPPPEECANCGESIPRNAHACPECGADERTGWREVSIYDGLDLPEESASDDTPTRKHSRTPGSLPWYGVVLVVVLLVILIAGALGLFR